MDVPLARRATYVRTLCHADCVFLLRISFQKWGYLPFSRFGTSSLLSCGVGGVPPSANWSTTETLVRALLFLLRKLGCSSGLDSVGTAKAPVCMGEDRANSPSRAVGRHLNRLSSVERNEIEK